MEIVEDLAGTISQQGGASMRNETEVPLPAG